VAAVKRSCGEKCSQQMHCLLAQNRSQAFWDGGKTAKKAASALRSPPPWQLRHCNSLVNLQLTSECICIYELLYNAPISVGYSTTTNTSHLSFHLLCPLLTDFRNVLSCKLTEKKTKEKLPCCGLVELVEEYELHAAMLQVSFRYTEQTQRQWETGPEEATSA